MERDRDRHHYRFTAEDCVFTLDPIPRGVDYKVCDTCDKVFTLSCLQEWLKHHMTCPHCRSVWTSDTLYKQISKDERPLSPLEPPGAAVRVSTATASAVTIIPPHPITYNMTGCPTITHFRIVYKSHVNFAEQEDRMDFRQPKSKKAWRQQYLKKNREKVTVRR